MTLILKLDLDMVKMYLHSEKKRSFYVKGFKSYSLNRQKHRQTDTQTDRHDRKHYLPAYAGGKYRSSPFDNFVNGDMGALFHIHLEILKHY